MKPYRVAVSGFSGSGKTQLIERLILYLRKRKLKVGVVKHAHDRIDLDRPGKDSWRLLKSGADSVAVVGPKQLMLVLMQKGADGLERAFKTLPEDLDLVFLEGFHRASYPQIVVADRSGQIRHGPHPIAIVSDEAPRCSIPWFRPEEVGKLARFIEMKMKEND
jgi:molybdopterin-guanine dinucleotide biosynthesis protein B